MNKINLQLEKIKKENRLGLMTHIVIGYPTIKESLNLVKLMARLGVDFVELQIPFSDPMADGPTIMKANKKSLDNGTRVRDSFRAMKELSRQVEIPLLFMGYFNVVLNYGVEKFCRDAEAAGASGLIFPDIPLEEEAEEHYIRHAKNNNLIPIRLLSPASTAERAKKNAKVAGGFLYYVGRKGTTGVKSSLDRSLNKHLKEIKRYIHIPIAVGFGISKKEHLQSLKGKAELAVIGSACLNAYTEARAGQGLKAVEKFLGALIAETKIKK
ncbi:MAG: tryptophan synthase subunit alpha [Patescibacteria group bacterium]|jgi:tryptophan synthase alpha subunit